jgi:hypothetical protein
MYRVLGDRKTLLLSQEYAQQSLPVGPQLAAGFANVSTMKKNQ